MDFFFFEEQCFRDRWVILYLSVRNFMDNFPEACGQLNWQCPCCLERPRTLMDLIFFLGHIIALIAL